MLSHRRIYQGQKVRGKIELVAKSYGLKGDKLGEFVRANGIYLTELVDWRDRMKSSLEGDRPIAQCIKTEYRRKIEHLEKRLKEALAIIELQKKVQKLLQGEEKSTKKKHDKKS